MALFIVPSICSRWFITCGLGRLNSNSFSIYHCWVSQAPPNLRAIDGLIASDKTLKRNAKLLASIPAVGKLTVPWLLAYLGDGSKFKKAKQATSFAGLTPMIHQSGTSVEKKPRISKIGHSEIRKVLYMPAMGFAFGKYKNGAYQSFVTRLNSHGKPKMVVIVALMRKILSIAQAVLKNQQPFNAALHKN